MEIICPNCGAIGQFAGKYCESCGYLIPAEGTAGTPDAQVGSLPKGNPALGTGSTGTGNAGIGTSGASAVAIGNSTDPMAAVAHDRGAGPASTSAVGAQFGVVRDGQARLDEGFTIGRVGEFLVGRMDQETGHQVDVDLRQWVQPLDVGGQKQYLVHRNQCYVGLASDLSVFLRPCPGAEADTLVKAPGDSTFTSVQNLGEKRPPRPDGSFELQMHDQIFMGDPDAVMYFLSGDPTALGSYVVVELINKS